MIVDKRKLYCMAARRGMGVTEMVQKAGISFQTLSSIKKGWRSTTKTISKLCDALQCDPADLVKDES